MMMNEQKKKQKGREVQKENRQTCIKERLRDCRRIVTYTITHIQHTTHTHTHTHTLTTLDQWLCIDLTNML